MKTYTSTLLLLASTEAAYGHSAKSRKPGMSASMSVEFYTKSAKSKEPIRRLLVNDPRDLHSAGSSMPYQVFDSIVAKSARTKSAKASNASEFGRHLQFESMSFDLGSFPSSASAKATKIPSTRAASYDSIGSKSSKTRSVKPITRAIDPVEMSNDNESVSQALSFIEFRSQVPAASEEANGATIFGSVATLITLASLLAASTAFML